MKILLIYPPLIDTVNGPISSEITAMSGFPPLHLLYIASHAKTVPGVEVKIVDCRLDNLNYEQLEASMRDYLPDVVGISVNSFMLLSALNVSKIVKKINQNIMVVFGGIHPTIYPRETIKFGSVDVLVLGEGEFVFRNLLQALIAQSDITSIPGIVTKKTVNPEEIEPQVIEDLDSLNIPAWELVDITKYVREKKPVLWLYTSRGCVGQCSFCYIHKKSRRFRAHSANYIYNNLTFLLEKYKLKEFYIADDCFTVNKTRVIEFCELIIKNKLKVRWGAVSRADTLSEDILEIISKAGCLNLFLGIETGDENIQKTIRKNLDLNKTKDIVRLANKYGLNPHAYFMIGHPQETEKEILNTIKYMCSLKLSGIAGGVAIFQPYPNTSSYIEGLRTGIIKNDYWREFATNPTEEFKFRYWNEKFSNEELLYWQKRVNSKFYLRPIIFIRTFIEAIRTRRLFSKIYSFLIFMKVTFKSK